MTTPPQDYFLTVDASIRAPEFKVRGSRFIADIHPVSSKDSIDKVLTSIRKEFYDATHHCFAYRLGPTGAIVRAADDGEPSGTAGKPILLILTSAKLTDTLLVVTRYFGGTKLGTGGLARAYAEAAQHAVSLAKPRAIFLTEDIPLQMGYDDLPHVERLVHGLGGETVDAAYLDSVRITVRLRRSAIDGFMHQLKDQFHGRVTVAV